VCVCVCVCVVTILEELKNAVEEGFSKYFLQQSPHLTLLSKDYYQYVTLLSLCV